jgi:hypothetical protein
MMASIGLHRLLLLTSFGCVVGSWVVACNSREYSISNVSEASGGDHSSGGEQSGGLPSSGGRTQHQSATAGKSGVVGGTTSVGSSTVTSEGGTSSVTMTSGGTTSSGGTTGEASTTLTGGTTGVGGSSSTGGTTGEVTSCTRDNDCAANPVKNICDVAHSTCVACIPGETACGAGRFCNSDYTCRIGCVVNSDCPVGTCDTSLNRCTGCTSNADCGGTDGTVECDTAHKICIEKGCKSTAGCRTGFTCSSGYCKNLTSDRYNCGTSEYVCSSANGTASCAAGKCAIACHSGYDNCHTDVNDGCESNLTSDAEHCSSCTKTCTAGQVCYSSSCVVPKPCTKYCANPTTLVIPTSGGVNVSGPTSSICFETYDATQAFGNGGCGDFASMSINGTNVACTGTWTWSATLPKPAAENGGHCFHGAVAISGKSSGWLTLWK